MQVVFLMHQFALHKPRHTTDKDLILNWGRLLGHIRLCQQISVLLHRALPECGNLPEVRGQESVCVGQCLESGLDEVTQSPGVS